MSRTDDIIYENVIDGRKCVMSKDKRNWIWGDGTPNELSKAILGKKTTCYYASIESMLVHLLEKRFREHVAELTLGNFKESLDKATREVREIGKKLDKVNWGALDRGAYCPKCNVETKERYSETL